MNSAANFSAWRLTEAAFCNSVPVAARAFLLVQIVAHPERVLRLDGFAVRVDPRRQELVGLGWQRLPRQKRLHVALHLQSVMVIDVAHARRELCDRRKHQEKPELACNKEKHIIL